MRVLKTASPKMIQSSGNDVQPVSEAVFDVKKNQNQKKNNSDNNKKSFVAEDGGSRQAVDDEE